MSLSDHDASRLRAAVAGCPDTFDLRFEILRDAGAGGMGRVYEAIDHGTGRRVAIKVVDRIADQTRFVAEAEILEKLDHDAIVSYVRHGATAAGDPYLVMDWLVGETLAARLADRGPLSVPEAVALGERLAGALVHAHDAGVVHRDLKPSNVLLVDGDVERATLIDFGVAKTERDLTHTGQLIGTPGYMAPEQVRGEKSLDGRVDLFALGCVLYEALAGRAPFEGAEVMEILARLLLEEPTPLEHVVPAVPPRLAALVGALLAKDASQRVAEAAIVRDELAAIRAALDGDDAPALRAPGPRIPQRKVLESAPTVDERRGRHAVAPIAAPRRTGRVVAAALVAIALVASVLVFGTRGRSDAGADAAVVIAPISSDAGTDAGVVIAPVASNLPPCSQYISTGCPARCAAGDGEACLWDGIMWYFGHDGRTADHTRGITQLTRGCDAGNNSACSSGGDKLLGLIQAGERPRDQAAEAERLLALGCKRGYTNACSRLGAEYLPRKGRLPTNHDRAFEILGPGCCAGPKFDFGCCKELKRALEFEGGTPSARERASAIVNEACRNIPRLHCKP